MKTHRILYLLSLLIMALSVIIGCRKNNEKDDLPFNIINGPDVTDADGNVYKTVIIGTQQWLAENLKVTSYSDDTPIPDVTGNDEWTNLTTPGLCWYNNDYTANRNIYGALYNWFAISSGNVCPEGWHVPSETEWKDLITYLGGTEIAGGRMKETGTGHWNGSNEGANNVVGFTALPGGYRNAYGYSGSGEICYFWTSQCNTYVFIESTGDYISVWSPWLDAKILGLSVRCIKD